MASVYHKPPNSFVDGAKLPIKKLGNAGVAESGGAGEAPALVSEAPAAGGPSIIPSQVNYSIKATFCVKIGLNLKITHSFEIYHVEQLD